MRLLRALRERLGTEPRARRSAAGSSTRRRRRQAPPDPLQVALGGLRRLLARDEGLDVLFALERELRPSYLPLPPPPAALLRAWLLEDGDPGRLAHVLGRDPALARILIAAAQTLPESGGAGDGSLREAIAALGPGPTLDLALGAGLRDKLFRPAALAGAAGHPPAEVASHWRHALAVGAAAHTLATEVGVESEAALRAGLLHDVGRLLLQLVLERLRQRRRDLWKRLDAYPGLVAAIGDAIHGPLGAHVARSWGLPKGVAAAIAFHHRLDSAPPEVLGTAATLAVADELGRRITGVRANRPGPRAASLLGLTPEAVAGLAPRAAETFAQLEKLL